MPTTAKPSRRTLLSLLPQPTEQVWGVALHFEDGIGHSNKEYRIVVDGNRTIYQYGRVHTPGVSIAKVFADHAAAVKDARSMWASKERKGYWPTTGVVTDPTAGGRARASQLSRNGWEVVGWINAAYESRAGDLLLDGRQGDQLWLVQAPGWDSPERDSATRALTNLLVVGGDYSNGVRRVRPAQYLVVSADDATSRNLVEVCPVALVLGARSDAVTGTLAEIAHTMWGDLEQMPARQGLDKAMEIAKAIIGV